MDEDHSRDVHELRFQSRRQRIENRKDHCDCRTHSPECQQDARGNRRKMWNDADQNRSRQQSDARGKDEGCDDFNKRRECDAKSDQDRAGQNRRSGKSVEGSRRCSRHLSPGKPRKCRGSQAGIVKVNGGQQSNHAAEAHDSQSRARCKKPCRADREVEHADIEGNLAQRATTPPPHNPDGRMHRKRQGKEKPEAAEETGPHPRLEKKRKGGAYGGKRVESASELEQWISERGAGGSPAADTLLRRNRWSVAGGGKGKNQWRKDKESEEEKRGDKGNRRMANGKDEKKGEPQEAAKNCAGWVHRGA